MRAYAFTHLQMSPGQRALQAAHAICRIRSAWKGLPAMQQIWDDWEEQHSTMIFLNGGFSGDLQTITKTIGDAVSKYDQFKRIVIFAAFCEDEFTLGGALTSVAMIVHPRYYTPIICANSSEFKISDLFIGCVDPLKAHENMRKLVVTNEKEPNKNDIVTHEWFEGYNKIEIDFIEWLSKFKLANLG